MIKASILNIKEILSTNINKIPLDSGALLNSSGISMFLLHYGLTFNDHNSLQLSKEIMNNLIDNEISYSEGNSSSLSFCSGVLGRGWLFNYMNNKGLWKNEYDLTDLDNLSLDFFTRNVNSSFLDYLHGASGALHYMSTRPYMGKSNKIINHMIDVLIEEAHYDNNCFYWENYNVENTTTQPNTINLGLSHGTPAILSILSKLNTNDRQDKINRILKMGAQTILKFKNNPSYISIFPYTVNIKIVDNSAHSRLGWCYGDLGVAITLWNIGTKLKDKNIIDESINIVKHSTKRTIENSNINDAAVCHGAIGIAHIFYKFYLKTGLNEFLTTSNYWNKIGLKMLNNKSIGITGQTKWTSDNGYQNSFSLLDGISGIGLCLIDRINKNKALNWDSSILL